MQRKALPLMIAAALAGTAGGIAQAQEAAGGLEEILVTATRRSQNLQEVPISIVALTGESLEMRGLDNLEKVSMGVPNIVITGGGGGTSNTNFRMRGIPNVGTYVDGVWQVGTNGFLTQEFVDIDRVEVLRGPQGTMFGRDSTGGAIRIWTKRPGDTFGGNITATTGSYNRRDVKASLDLPLGDKVKSKWTGASLNRDGYIDSLTTGEAGGYIDQQVFRGDVVWEPTDKLSFRFNYQSDENTFTEPRVQDAMFRTYDDPAPAWVKSIIGLPEMYTYVGQDFQGKAVEPFFNPLNQVAGFPGGKVGKWQNRSGTTLPNRFKTEQLSVETDWNFSENMKLQFLTATTDQHSNQVVDWDNSQYDLVLDINQQKLDVFSQEIQLTGGRGKVEWLGGVYYWDQKQNNRGMRWQVNEFQKGLMDPFRVFNNAVCNPAGAPTELTPSTTDNPNNRRFVFGATGTNGVNYGGAASNGAGAWQTCQQIYYGGVGGAFDTLSRSGQDGWAAFGEATIHFTDTLDLTIGLRQHDQSGFTVNMTQVAGRTAAKPLDPTQFPVGDSFAGADNTSTYTPFKFDKLTSRLVLQKQFKQNIMGYVSYSEGFNSGGVSAAIIGTTRTLFPFKPATLENTEIGMRSDLAGGKVRLNATVFHTIWADLQAAGVVTDPTTGAQIPTLLTTNVGEAKAEGMEVELTFLPTANLAINVGLGLLDTSYTSIKPGTYSGHLPFTTGLEFADAPDTSYTIGLQHTANLKSGGSWTTRLDYNYQGQFWRSEPFLRVSGYQAVPDGYEEAGDWGITNVRFTYEPADGNWAAAIFGTNITNEYTLNSGFFHGIWGYDFATVGRPREVGASINFRF
ncbi:MAG TPA: TonB-dependent receptor [Gammaproteobacteria bacterium]|nr:TonB-dependent receptor [Gammaproteobacteria bacterium]